MTERLLNVMQIGHTPAGIILFDSLERKPIGRYRATLTISITTRMVIKYHVSFEALSRLSVVLCLRREVAPKAGVLVGLESIASWPPQGMSHAFHVDNGRDLPARAFQQACAPFILSASETGLDDRESIMTYEHPGEVPRVWPIRYLMWHEIVNDEVGGVPIVVTYRL